MEQRKCAKENAGNGKERMKVLTVLLFFYGGESEQE